MAAIWSFLMVAMVSLYGVCLSIPSDDRKEPWTTLDAESSAQEEASESKAISMPSLDMSAQKPRPQRSVSNILSLRSVMKRVLHHIFGVVSAVNEDSLLATDMVDESWAKWIQKVHQFLPVFPIKYVLPHDIENPMDDTHSPLWDYLLALLLKGSKFASVETDDTDGDEGAEVENAVTSTTITFDPIGQLLGMMHTIVKSVTLSDSMKERWEKFKENLKTYSVFSEDTKNITERQGIVDFFGIGIPAYFFGGYSLGEFDLLKLALNILAFLGFRSLFLRQYFPIPGVDDVGSYPDMQDYAYDEDEDEEEEEGYGQNDDGGDEDEEENGYNQYDDGGDEDEEENGYSQYDDGGDQDEEENGYNQYDVGGDQDEEEGYYHYYHYRDDDNQSEMEGHHQYDNNNQDEEEGYLQYYINNHKEESYLQYDNDGGSYQIIDHGYGEGANQGGYQEANQGFDQSAHQETDHSANLGFDQSTYQGFGGDANQGSHDGFEQGVNQGLDQGVDGLYQSSYQGNNQDFVEGFHQSVPQGGEDTDRQHTTGWPKPAYYNLSPEFNRNRYIYRKSYAQGRDDTQSTNYRYTYRGSNGQRWSDFYKNNYGNDQGTIPRSSYGKKYPYRNSYNHEQDRTYRNNYGQRYPYRNSFGYRRNNTHKKGYAPRRGRPHVATRRVSISGKK